MSRRRFIAALSCAAACGGEPPEAADAWTSALGDLEDIEPELQVAFTDPGGFLPLPPARAGEWRSVRPEPPQSVAEFRAAGPNVRAAPREKLVLLPRGRFPFEVIVGREFVGLVRSPPLADIAAMLAAFFAASVEVRRAEDLPVDPLPRREVQGHQQIDARALLAALAPQLPGDAYGMLALVNVDLFAERAQQYTFGWSTLQERLAVVSFTRFDPSFFGGAAPDDLAGALLRRSLRVAVHEVGHLFGLAHCQAFRCVMNGVAHLAELDAIPLHLCPVCLRKLHVVTGLDPRRRDAALLAVYERLGLAEEARWTRERRSRLWGVG